MVTSSDQFLRFLGPYLIKMLFTSQPTPSNIIALQYCTRFTLAGTLGDLVS